MKFIYAKVFLEKGEKIRRKDWKEGSYICGTDPVRFKDGEPAFFTLKWFKVDDWEEYIEEDWSLRRSCGCQPWNETDLKKLKAKILEDIDRIKRCPDCSASTSEDKCIPPATIRKVIIKRFGF